MCPYARFQSVMVDKDTFVVTYDKMRGEPRGSRNKSDNQAHKGLGDCVDCSICVQVCPTGIDIRDGLQYMCIGCGACIDACNQVMDKMNYPKGLVRYTTERAMLNRESNQSARSHLLRPRILIYTSIILVLTSVFMFSLFTRNPLRVDVMRDRGALAREVDGRYIENIYRVQLMNSSESPMRVDIKATGLPDIAVLDAGGKVIDSVVIAPASNLLIPVKVSVAINEAISGSHPIQFQFRGQEGEHIRSRDEKSSFIVPRQ
jgi:cytochrome c oxidase accessory protein FixG